MGCKSGSPFIPPSVTQSWCRRRRMAAIAVMSRPLQTLARIPAVRGTLYVGFIALMARSLQPSVHPQMNSLYRPMLLLMPRPLLHSFSSPLIPSTTSSARQSQQCRLHPTKRRGRNAYIIEPYIRPALKVTLREIRMYMDGRTVPPIREHAHAPMIALHRCIRPRGNGNKSSQRAEVRKKTEVTCLL